MAVRSETFLFPARSRTHSGAYTHSTKVRTHAYMYAHAIIRVCRCRLIILGAHMCTIACRHACVRTLVHGCVLTCLHDYLLTQTGRQLFGYMDILADAHADVRVSVFTSVYSRGIPTHMFISSCTLVCFMTKRTTPTQDSPTLKIVERESARGGRRISNTLMDIRQRW